MDTASLFMTAAGAGLALMGLLTLARSRRPIEVEEQVRAAGVPPPARTAMDRAIDRFGLTTPTIITIGMCLLIGGYHLVAWALPPAWLPMRLDAAWWWTLPVGAAVLIAASLGIDRVTAGPP